MLSTVAIVPDHPVCIPDIGGEHITAVEQSVNGMLKLAIKLHAEKTDLLVCVTSGLPVLHHRLLLGKGKEFVRFFASNIEEGKEIHMTFPGATELYTSAELMISDQKVPVEGYVQEGDAVAIDNGLLSFLFYCHSIEFYPQLLVVGVSDLSPAKHAAAGQAIARMLSVQEDLTSAVILCGSTQQESSSLMADSTWDVLPELEGTLQMPAAVGFGIMEKWHTKSGLRLLGQDIFEGREMTVGYFRAMS